ncbi:hypothetical protein WFZ85_02845 [Flavobacterium sp. j3]|uniref:YD repeat-containing protein n=1 Tax=Flavobacterium aureirubrum TaxID=3133147 RepID=A0ABU9N1Z5_9FLAO
MKKSIMIAALTLLTISPTFANSWRTVSTCQKRLNFFGLVEVWSGSITHFEYDPFGNATGNFYKTDCTSDGNWDWAW